MFPSASERRGPGRAQASGQAGFSLTELLITMVVAVLIGVALVRFYKDSYHAYSMQDQISDRNQNAQFTLSKLVELLQQAGSGLPDSGWTVLSVSGKTLNVGVNPRGGEQYNGFDLPYNNFIPVTDASKFDTSANVFLNTTNVLLVSVDPKKDIQKLTLDPTYNSRGFVNGIKDNATGLDSIRIKEKITLAAGDRLYAYREDQYELSGTDLVVRLNGDASTQMVMSENIDSVGFTFFDQAGGATSLWEKMRSASIVVRAQTEQMDTKLKPAAYHKITLPMNVMLRNKK